MQLDVEAAVLFDVGNVVYVDKMINARCVGQLERRDCAQFVGGGQNCCNAALRDHGG